MGNIRASVIGGMKENQIITPAAPMVVVGYAGSTSPCCCAVRGLIPAFPARPFPAHLFSPPDQKEVVQALPP